MPQRGDMFVTKLNTSKKTPGKRYVIFDQLLHKHIAPKGAKNMMETLATNILPLRGKEQATHQPKTKTRLITILLLPLSLSAQAGQYVCNKDQYV